MREITIKANGCHDCAFRIFSPIAFGYFCYHLHKDISTYAVDSEFHPDCPMKETKENQ